MIGQRTNPMDPGTGPWAPPSHSVLPRRGLLGGAGLALGSAITPAFSPVASAIAQPLGAPPVARPADGALHRRALEVRESCARSTHAIPIAPHPTNDDEMRYPSRIGTDTRGLPHNARGEVDQAAWRALFGACQSADPADFEKVPLGGTRRLGNPVGTLAVSLGGLDPTQIAIPAPVALASAARAAEAVEVYWQALLRDVPFAEYRDDTENREVRAACDELSRMADFRGPQAAGRVTPRALFCGNVLYFDAADPKGRAVTPPGVLEGPVISQFLLRDIPCGAQSLSARIRAMTQDSEFLIGHEDWLRAQNGEPPRGRPRFDPTPRYISTGRDLAESVRQGLTLAGAMPLLMATPAGGGDPRYDGMFPPAPSPMNASNPYRGLRSQGAGSASFGLPHIQAMVGEGINRAARSAYWQKWFVHRTLRPEAYGGLAHHRLVNGVTEYPLHDAFLKSEALDRTRIKQGTHLLSQTFPDGSPPFSAYPGGGASVAGVTATLLKAFFDESMVIASPMQPDPRDPTRLVAYVGPPLTVGAELNKMAVNFAMGRNWSGIHWRSDASSGMAIGEDVAIGLLRDERATFREAFDGFSFTRFDGSRVTI